MCRIAGMVDKRAPEAQVRSDVQTMCDVQKHGGPDDEGLYYSETFRCALGNRRLSLLDLTAGGKQPMQYGERYTITYNGELYNFFSLKAELIALGHYFKNETDTEVILAAFAEWGEHCFYKLHGMFAFALLDEKTSDLYLVRDAVGIKPLYYSTASGRLVFASELKAFKAIRGFEKKDERAEVFLLAYGYLPEPCTSLADVQTLPPGSFLKYNTSATTYSLQQFRFFSFSNGEQNKNEALQQVRSSVTNAVRSQIIADAPVGIFLSGGIDSTIIASIAAEEKRSLTTLSVYFNEPSYSEKKYQDIVAKQVASDHHAILLEEKQFQQELPQWLSSMDCPSSDGINTWFISKYARETGLKAVLSGIGSDELFGSYPSFQRMRFAKQLQQTPNFLLRYAGRAKDSKYARAAYLRIPGLRGLYLFLRGYYTPGEIAEITGKSKAEVWEVLCDFPASPRMLSTDPRNFASLLEFSCYMKDQLLRDADVMSMSNSLEIRVPFLDNNVIETAFNIRPSLRLHEGPKSLLINAFRERIPAEISDRKKMGFSFPFGEWLKHSDLTAKLREDENKYVRQSTELFLRGQRHWSKIMAIMVMKQTKNADAFSHA